MGHARASVRRGKEIGLPTRRETRRGGGRERDLDRATPGGDASCRPNRAWAYISPPASPRGRRHRPPSLHLAGSSSAPNKGAGDGGAGQSAPLPPRSHRPPPVTSLACAARRFERLRRFGATSSRPCTRGAGSETPAIAHVADEFLGARPPRQARRRHFGARQFSTG